MSNADAAAVGRRDLAADERSPPTTSSASSSRGRDIALYTVGEAVACLR
jgi:hypothetical protein